MLLFKNGEPANWKACVLTAASNLITIKPPAPSEESKDIKFYYSTPDTLKMYGIFLADHSDLLPQYTGAPELGNNIGLVWLKNAEKVFEPDAPNALNLSWDKSIEELNIQKGE